MISSALLFLLAFECRPVEIRYGLPAGLLAAVVWIESSGRTRLISKRRTCGGRDYGLGQIHAHDPSQARLRQLLTVSVNLDRSGAMLGRSAEKCALNQGWKACRRSRWALYNAASATWWPRVARAWRKIAPRSARGGES